MACRQPICQEKLFELASFVTGDGTGIVGGVEEADFGGSITGTYELEAAYQSGEAV